jgi:hypothetical protein
VAVFEPHYLSLRWCGLLRLVAIRLAVSLALRLFTRMQNSFAVGGLTADHEVGPDTIVVCPAVGVVRLLFVMTQNSFAVGGLTADHKVGPDAFVIRPAVGLVRLLFAMT